MPDTAIDTAGRDAKGWRVVIGCSIAIWFTGSNVFGYFGVFNSYLTENVGDVSLTMTCLLISLGIGMFLAAVWHKKLGTRNMFILGALCTIVAQICIILAPVFRLPALSLLWGFFTGANSCFIYSPGLTTVQNWFPNKRGLVTGIVNLIFGGASAITSIVYRNLFVSFGFAATNWIIMVVSVVVTLIGAFMSCMPEDAHFTEAQQAAHDKLLAEVSAKKGAQALGKSMSVGEAVKTSAFWALWFMWLFMGSAGISMTSLSTQYADYVGLVDQRVICLTCFSVTNGVSRIIAGPLSDKIGRRQTGLVGLLIAAVGYAILPSQTALVPVGILCACVGYGFGTMFAITAPLSTDLFGLKDFGRIFGLIFTAYGFIGGIVGPLLAAQVLAMTNNNFGIVFGYLAVFCAIGAVSCMFAKKPKQQAELQYSA